MKSIQNFKNAQVTKEETKSVQGGGKIIVFDAGDFVDIITNGESLTTFVDGMNWGSDKP